ncbi:MAG: wax ester/triacylglycerol synthase family O-acyltransferase [Gammaproteobacteria bacterium]|nr:wax ester/triacylglycerol synthase family O-acyltransferase [Gammaproteobacteria bacterium]
MQQLGGLDNLMIAGEVPNIPMHMSALMIYETGGKAGTNRFAEALESRFLALADQHFPILRCRLETLPLQLDNAYWVEDPRFNLHYHISRVALPSPGNWQQLYALFARFHAQPLDHARPLWEVMMVEGLDRLEGVPRGSTALFLKIHHAVVDGKSALRLITSLHSLDPDPDAPTLADTMPDNAAPDSDFQAPSLISKYGRAWWHSIERPLDMAGTLVKLLPDLLSGATSANKDAAPRPPTPHAFFNAKVDADRVVGHIRMDMALLRRLEKKHHCTINDIALCVVAGALRHYLLETGQLPQDDLQALMPIDIRRKDKDGTIGNHLSVAKVCLYTSYSEPDKRLAAICSESSAGKRQSKKKSNHALLHLVDDIHPAVMLWLGQWLINSGQIDKLPQTVNTVVTNVPGLSSEAYLVGARLIDYLGFGPLAPNMGLFHTVSSTQDHVNVTFLSTAAFVGDGTGYLKALQHSLAEVSALKATGTPGRKPRAGA